MVIHSIISTEDIFNPPDYMPETRKKTPSGINKKPEKNEAFFSTDPVKIMREYKIRFKS